MLSALIAAGPYCGMLLAVVCAPKHLQLHLDMVAMMYLLIGLAVPIIYVLGTAVPSQQIAR